MKLVCDREELSKGLQSVLRSVGMRAGIPALSGVLVELTDNDLSLTTTDLELTTRVRLALTGEAGKVLVPARLFAEIVRSLPSDEVELFTENGTVRVAGGRARFEIRSLPPEDFPQVDTVSETRSIGIAGDTLAKALGQVTPAASRDETRPVLTGVLLEGEGGELRLVATDSYRLAVRTLEGQEADGLRVLIPARAVVEVARLAGSNDVKIDVSSSQAGFTIGDTVVQSRLIEGEFPAYGKLLPTDLPSSLQISKEPFVEALKRVAVLAQDATPVFIEFADGNVRLSCHAQGLGEAAEDVDGAYTGEDMRVAFNAGYLETGVVAVEGDDVQIELADAQRPVLVHAPGDRAYVYLLMPIRVS